MANTNKHRTNLGLAVVILIIGFFVGRNFEMSQNAKLRAELKTANARTVAAEAQAEFWENSLRQSMNDNRELLLDAYSK